MQPWRVSRTPTSDSAAKLDRGKRVLWCARRTRSSQSILFPPPVFAEKFVHPWPRSIGLRPCASYFRDHDIARHPVRVQDGVVVKSALLGWQSTNVGARPRACSSYRSVKIGDHNWCNSGTPLPGFTYKIRGVNTT